MHATSLTDKLLSEYNLRRDSYITHLHEVAQQMKAEADLLVQGEAHPQAPWSNGVRLLVQTKTQLDALRDVLPYQPTKGT
jgi:hypothetical protein